MSAGQKVCVCSCGSVANSKSVFKTNHRDNTDSTTDVAVLAMGQGILGFLARMLCSSDFFPVSRRMVRSGALLVELFIKAYRK
jgi:hypothetical protein